MKMNPYEIRLELLKLARDILQDENSNKIQQLQVEWENNNKKTETFPELHFSTADDIIRTAEKLNGFISKT
jgi:hypothetical protein